MAEIKSPSESDEMQAAASRLPDGVAVISDIRGSIASTNRLRSQANGAQARTEIKNSFSDGFVLDDIELTRIKDVQNDLIKKINNGKEAMFDFR